MHLPSISNLGFESRWTGEFKSSEAGSTGRSDLFARLGIGITFLALAWYTCAHWGDLRIDCGRELYVPAAILNGKMLYRDLWYPYGPLAPYCQAVLFRLFGVHLNVLYLFGLSLTISFAMLLFALSRRFLPTTGAFLVSFCFLMQGFNPDIFNYVFPYSYAALMGALLGLVFLYFLVRHILNEPGPNLLVAGFSAGLALLCKQEFGVACYMVLAFVLVLQVLAHRSARRLAFDLLRCAPGLLTSVVVYGWFVWRLSPRFIFLENFQQTPGSYFMRTFGVTWVSHVGLRFIPYELFKTVLIAIFSIAVWFVLASVLRHASGRRWVLLCTVAAAGLGVMGYLLDFRPVTFIFSKWPHAVFPTGMFWVACLLFFWKIIDLLRSGFQANYHLALGAVAAYALAVGVRIMVQVVAYEYAVFYNSALFLVFMVVVTQVIKAATQNLKARQQSALLNGLLILEGIGLAFLLFPHPEKLRAPLVTDLGTIYTRPAEAALFPQIISFMREQKVSGKRVLVLPEEVTLYCFSGTDAPTRWYQLTPGILAPEQESEYIAQLEAKRIDYILLSNRSFFEYKAPFFGLDFNQTVYRWIEANYEVVGEFGQFQRMRGSRFAMLIYKKRGETAE